MDGGRKVILFSGSSTVSQNALKYTRKVSLTSLFVRYNTSYQDSDESIMQKNPSITEIRNVSIVQLKIIS